MFWNLVERICHSFSNSILSILSAFLWEIEAPLLPKKNFLLKYASHKSKMRNKGVKFLSFQKNVKYSNILMLIMCPPVDTPLTKEYKVDWYSNDLYFNDFT